MAYMLAVAAFKIGHPVILLILVKPDNFAYHSKPWRQRLTSPRRPEPLE